MTHINQVPLDKEYSYPDVLDINKFLAFSPYPVLSLCETGAFWKASKSSIDVTSNDNPEDDEEDEDNEPEDMV